MYRKLCIAVRITTSVSHIMYRILLYRISCIAFHVARPWEATGHRRPREATGGHRRPREATGGHGPHPTVPPKILYLLKWAGRGRQKGRLRRKPATGGNGGQRGATGGNGAAEKKSGYTNRPPSISSRTPTSCACLGNIYDGTYTRNNIYTIAYKIYDTLSYTRYYLRETI